MSPATEKARHLATVRFWAHKVAHYQLRGSSAESVLPRLTQAMSKAQARGWSSEAVGAREKGFAQAKKVLSDKGRPFSSLAIGDTFDFIDPNPEWVTLNSFFATCTKTGARSYSYEQGGRILRNSVGSIRAKVFHVLKKSRIASDPNVFEKHGRRIRRQNARMPSAMLGVMGGSRSEVKAREREEMAAILKKHGFHPGHAKKLQDEGMGPFELEGRARLPANEVGGLTYTHRIPKNREERRDPRRATRRSRR